MSAKFAILPLVGRRIPIVADEYSDPEKGTGAVKITPAHDFNDFEVGRRHKLPLVNIFGTEAQLALAGNEAFLEGVSQNDDLKAVLALDGLDRFEARKRIVAMLEERELLVQIEPHAHTVPHGDRSNVVIEPYLTDQWYVNVKPLAERALGAVRQGKTKFVPENWEKTYFQWLENIEPWCVSRQLWWGHQIPAWYDDQGNVFVALSEEDAKAQARAKNGRDVPLKRDEDVLDTWFSSALWPFSTLGWPDDTPELERYYPTNTLVTGFDIIFFWVARMMMMGLHFMDEVPFDTVYIHALVRDEKGAKMSKSKGNVIDPLDVVEQYGADALRMTLAAMAAQGRDIKLSRPARGELPQLRDQDLERGALCRDERVPARRRLRSEIGEGDAQQMGAQRMRQGDRRSVGRHPGLQVQRGGARRLPLRLERVLRLDARTRQARAAGRGFARQGRDPRHHRLHLRRDLQAAASLHALPHGGAVGDQGRGGAEARDDPRAHAVARSRSISSTSRPRPRSAGWWISSTRSAPPGPRPTCRQAPRSRSRWSRPPPMSGPAPVAGAIS